MPDQSSGMQWQISQCLTVTRDFRYLRVLCERFHEPVTWLGYS